MARESVSTSLRVNQPHFKSVQVDEWARRADDLTDRLERNQYNRCHPVVTFFRALVTHYEVALLQGLVSIGWGPVSVHACMVPILEPSMLINVVGGKTERCKCEGQSQKKFPGEPNLHVGSH